MKSEEPRCVPGALKGGSSLPTGVRGYKEQEAGKEDEERKRLERVAKGFK